MAVQIQLRNGTAAQWTAANPVLAAGEVGIESDTRKQKFGDGTTAWNSLAYAGGAGTVTGVTGTSPVVSSGGAAPAISLASGYGDTLNPYASKTANQVLAAPNGTSGVPSFRALVSADIPTLNQNTTGTAAGLSSTLAVASGGTGQTTAISAFNALAPSQSGNSGKYLTTDGTNSSWGTVSGGGSPGGANTNLQFNSSGSFGGSANLTWDGTNVQLGGTGALRFADTDNSNYVAFKSPGTVTSNVTWTLPATDGTSSQVLSTNGSGTLSWATAGGASAATATTLGTVYSSDAGTGVGLGQGVLANQSGTVYNTAMGFGAFPGATPFTGQRNTAIGTFSGNQISSGSYNTLVGMYSGANITTGESNVCVGRNAGISRPVTGSNNIQVGDNTNLTSDAAVGQIVIGSLSGSTITAKGDNTAFIGGASGAYNGQNSAAWLIASDQRLKKNIVDNNVGLDAIKSIQIRNFEYRLPEEVDSELLPDDAIIKSGVQLGVIAQELQAVLPDCVKQESTGVLSVNSDNLTYYTINAIKQLSAALDAANARIAALEAK